MLLNCKGKLIDLSTPKIMGILNNTPDSFYDGGRYTNEGSWIERAKLLLDQGADIIDIGAYSSRPNAAYVSEEEEGRRIEDVVKAIVDFDPSIVISVDTFRSSVAQKAISSGAAIINDISGGLLDPVMFETVADLQVPYVMMHMRGTPQTMTTLTQYDHLLTDVRYYFSERVELATRLGIKDVILDPGFGFAKTLDQNYELMSNLKFFKDFDLPILVGISRKSMVYNLFGTSPKDALNGTTALHMYSLLNGANILRVHDVSEAKECVDIYSKLNHYDK